MRKILFSLMIIFMSNVVPVYSEPLAKIKHIEETVYNKETYGYIYNKIEKGVIELKEEVYIDKSVLYTRDLDHILNQVFEDQGEINYIQACKYMIREDGTVQKIEFEYYTDLHKVRKIRKQTDEKAEQILDHIIKEGMTDFEKEVAIHDYVVNNTRYDYENYKRDTIPYESHTTYGVLVKKVGVCDGYAKAMKILLNKAGIRCRIITGKTNEGWHAWNIVKIDDVYYHVDATFNDVHTDTGVEVLSYAYFNIPDKEISYDHKWNKDKYPICHQWNNEYYKNNKGIFKEVENYDEFYKCIEHVLKEKKQYVFIKTKNSNKAIYDLDKVLNSMERTMNLKYSIKQSLDAISVTFEYKN